MSFTIDIREADGLRSLRFESACVQGAMHLGRPWTLVLEYTQAMMTGLLMRAEDFPREVLLIGLGAGSLAKFLYRHYPQAKITVVEIEPRVVSVAYQHFALPEDDARLKIVVGDGFEFMKQADDTYDLIMVDGFNEHAHPGDLNTLPFYEACRLRLKPQGMLTVNLIGLSRQYKGGFKYIETAFDGQGLLLPRCQSGNSIALATVGEPITLAPEELRHRADEMVRRTGLDLRGVIERLVSKEAGEGSSDQSGIRI